MLACSHVNLTSALGTLSTIVKKCNILFYIYRNDENVEGATHKHVVELIRSGGKSLSLVILTLPPSEVTKLEPLEDVMNPDYFDYSDKNQINITIPETRQIENGREKYAVRY